MAIRWLAPRCKSGSYTTPVTSGGTSQGVWPVEVDRLFDALFGGWPMEILPWAGVSDGFGSYAPQLEVSETDKEIRISAELPGLDQKDVEVTLEHGVLSIRGEKKAQREERDQHVYRSERTYGAFQRAIPIPVEVDEGKVSATFKKGVLSVILPKTARAQEQVRRIDVKDVE